MHLPRLFTFASALLLITGLLASGALWAQTPPEITPEATPETPARDCSPVGITRAQADLNRQLAALTATLITDNAAALESLYQVGAAYQQLALDCGYIPDNIGELFVGSDVDAILTALESVSGDPLRGQLLYNNEENGADGNVLACVGCHLAGAVGPMTEGTWTRWDEERRLDPALQDYTFERFIVESIVYPNGYIPEGYLENMMPQNYGDRLSYQDLADLILYLESQDQLLPTGQ